MSPNDADGMANSVDPDQTASLGAVWSGSALFAQTCLSENLGKLRYLVHKLHKSKILLQKCYKKQNRKEKAKAGKLSQQHWKNFNFQFTLKRDICVIK